MTNEALNFERYAMRLKQSLSLAALFVCTTIANAGLPDALRALERGDFDTAINELRPLLDPGSAEIQTLLGQALIGKGGSPQSLAEAVSFLRQAATSGNQKAMLLLSRLLETNKYVPQDDKESLKWLLVLAEQKNPYGLALLSKRYDEGSLEEQTEIVRRVETLFAFADRLETRLAQAQTAATRLTPALLAKAFRGELVPQDPNDEPAAELLRRLAQAPAAASPRKGRKAASAAV